ncbi:MAG: hypothetical protein LBE83_00435 [Propionibacteriaceae bacterium]|nr:hypothetical protein [Propionibacteriaceae bacterium]
MTGTYFYDPEAMKGVATQLTNAQTEIGDQVATVLAAVTNLVESGFVTATASGAYETQFNELANGLKQVSENLGPLGEFLTGYVDGVTSMDGDMGASISAG